MDGYDVDLFVNKKIHRKEIKTMLGEAIASSIRVIVKPSFIQPRGSLDLYHSIYRSLIEKLRLSKSSVFEG